jgi:hypothetical protein
MADICFSEDQDGAWVVARWAFRQILQDVVQQYAGDSEIEAVLIRAEATGYLHVDSLDNSLGRKITAAIQEVATGILAGTVRSGVSDRHRGESTEEEYRKGLRMLLAALPKQGG